jgi:hypothetical protein
MKIRAKKYRRFESCACVYVFYDANKTRDALFPSLAYEMR